MIVPIGEWVLRTACDEAAGWPNELRRGGQRLAVQFASPASGGDGHVGAGGKRARSAPARARDHRERAAGRSAAPALSTCCRACRPSACGLALDDFGTGYSSLSYLTRFPFDKIKIDQTFVAAPADDPAGLAIVRAIVCSAQSLGMTTVAEGVETEEQLDRVAADGCTDVQGYLISRPLPPERIADFMALRQGGVARTEEALTAS